MVSPMYPLTKQHYLAFGVIVHSFARFERLIELTIHFAIGGKAFGLTAMTISGLSYQAKSDALAALLMTVKLPGEHNGVVSAHLTEFNKHLALRNLIAHHVWRDGKRPGSIKPLKVSTRGGKRRLQGVRDEDADYTIAELGNVATALNDRCEAFASFLDSVGAFASIDAKTEAANAG